LGKDPRLSGVLDSRGAELLMVSALLHDLGHWPFCHAIEDLSLPELESHEAFAAEFLKSHRELAQVLIQDWGIQPGEVLDVLDPRTDSPALRLIRSVLSGPIDIDKMDYLDRDSLHCGVPYGRNFDRQRLMQSLVLNENADGLAVTMKGRTAAELMVFARYVMFSEVYWHHTVRAATCMFARGFYELKGEIDLSRLFQQTEAETIAEMRHRAAGTTSEALIEGLFGSKRRLYKTVAEFSFYQTPELYQPLARKPFRHLMDVSDRLSGQLAAKTGIPLSATDVLIDAPPPHREVEFNVPIYFPKEGIYRPLHEVSPVVEALARTQFDDYVKRVRVFVHPDRVSAVAEHVAACLREIVLP
jgi:HD superfamily phosphohydrolase